MLKSIGHEEPNKLGEPDNSEDLEKPQPKYNVVEFLDGVNGVSSTWLNAAGDYCKWPHAKIGIPYKKLAQFHAVPTRDWTESRVIRNFGTYCKLIHLTRGTPNMLITDFDGSQICCKGTPPEYQEEFDVAQKKLKLALQFSDIDTDVDDSTRKKGLSSKEVVDTMDSDEDEIDLPPCPVAPSLQKTRATKNQKDKVNDTGTTHTSRSPTPSTSSCTNSFSHGYEPYKEDFSVEPEILFSKSRPAISSLTCLNPDQLKNTSGVKHNFGKQKNHSVSSTATDGDVTNADLKSIAENLATLTYLVRKFMTSIDKVEEYLRQIRQENGTLEGTPAAVLQELGTIFPLNSMPALEELESSLKSNSQRARDVVQLLKGIGGNSVDDAIRRMLRKVYTNGFAELFSWEGRKGKAKLCDLEITKLMLTALKSMPGMKEADFENRLKEWFRHAKTRQQNEEKRAPKADA